eukprot:CAMPEP_0174736414 /NCGR_PEP_ID=MMETSP1094-20130205/66637_1 /TAXON_ID=156173 /ORGANISM="Chrysochromulina brevifilum, Strain UTEX LB 985" /LENGTH=117 /DNA_ID=CAMNT_0015939507 /DNA_START=62 /DNA_END=415 /DNA_ORIENTATION=-
MTVLSLSLVLADSLSMGLIGALRTRCTSTCALLFINLVINTVLLLLILSGLLHQYSFFDDVSMAKSMLYLLGLWAFLLCTWLLLIAPTAAALFHLGMVYRKRLSLVSSTKQEKGVAV